MRQASFGGCLPHFVLFWFFKDLAFNIAVRQ